MGLLRKLFKLVVVTSLIIVVAGLAWVLYGEIGTSAAAHFDESIDVVGHQTDQLSSTLSNTGALVQREVSEIMNISELVDQWTPRYQRAKLVYEKFDLAIVAAEEQAEAYFASQNSLTTQYHDPAKRAQAKAHDESDYSQYRQWREQAHQVRAQAKAIVHRLDDMNLDLQKLELSSEISFNAGGFSEVPSAIVQLDSELAQFQLSSGNIRAITSSPFEAQ